MHQGFVAVDGLRVHGHQFRQHLELAREISFEHRAHAVFVFGVVKQIFLTVRQALVNVGAATGILLRPLRHEAWHDSEAPTDFFRG